MFGNFLVAFFGIFCIEMVIYLDGVTDLYKLWFNRDLYAWVTQWKCPIIAMMSAHIIVLKCLFVTFVATQ